MPVVVLCDGAPASLKATEFAGFPNFFINSTDQMILVHSWNAARLAKSETGLTMRESPSANGEGGSPPATSFFHGPPTTPSEAARQAVSRISPETLELQRQCLPVPYVINAHISLIKESKTLKDFLNYKLEISSTPINDTKSDDEIRGKKAGVRSSAGNSRPTKDGIPPLKPQELSIEEMDAAAGTYCSEYALQRAEHHKADTVCLGVGNTMSGKVLRIGAPASMSSCVS